MVQQAVGTCIAGVAESLITPERDARAESSTESCFAEVLAELVHVERVSVDSNFFDDLGADSMVMAQFCARVRKRPDLPAVSIKDIYQHPTIASLATALTDAAPVPLERVLADVLADVVRAERVSVDSNFFDDLGADSMVMARFCARVQEAAGPAVGVDQGHLPAPHDRKPGDGTRGRRACACRVAGSGPGRGGEAGGNMAGTSSAGRCSC